ncbi:hypothetical protein GN956_G14294 [Arapaima gigas]
MLPSLLSDCERETQDNRPLRPPPPPAESISPRGPVRQTAAAGKDLSGGGCRPELFTEQMKSLLHPRRLDDLLT